MCEIESMESIEYRYKYMNQKLMWNWKEFCDKYLAYWDNRCYVDIYGNRVEIKITLKMREHIYNEYDNTKTYDLINKRK